MDDYDDIDNNWGNKHSDYYEGRKLKKEKEEDNFIEEEEAAIKLQQAKLKKLKEMNLLDSDQEDEASHKEKVSATIKKAKGRPCKPGKPSKQVKNPENYFDLSSSSSSDSEKNKKKKIKAKTLNKEEKDEMSQILKNIKIHINEIEENTNPIIEILKTESLEDKLTNTMKYLKLKKNLHLIYTIYNLYSLNYKNQKKISDHHPVWKKILMTKNELDGLKEKDSKIFAEIDNLLTTINENKNEGQDEGEDDIEEINEDENDAEDEDEEEESSEDEVEQKFLNKKRTKDFITDNENKFTKLKENKKKNLEKEKENIIKEVDNKNLLGQRLANQNILKSRGLYRKRKKYQGNAKLHLREKYSKKEKLRKNLVREYTGKPEVYTGEASGMRRDIIRSTTIK